MVGRKWWCWIVSMLGFSLCEVSLVQPGEVKSRVNQELLLFTLLLVRVLWHSLKTGKQCNVWKHCSMYLLYIVHTAQNSFQKCSEIFITSFVATLGLNIYSTTIIVKVNQSYHWTEKYYLFYISISYLIQSSVHCKVLKKESFVSNHHIPIYT